MTTKTDLNPTNIVRLQVEGARTIVNAIEEQETPQGVSLICPFPALEMEVPVSFGQKGGLQSRIGTLHRISVEDDPITGLPRLRLSIRAEIAHNTQTAQPLESLPKAPDHVTETTLRDTPAETGFSFLRQTEAVDLPWIEGDPDWVNAKDFSSPEDIMARAPKRLGYRLVQAAAWSAVVAALALGGYALHRSGIANTKQLRATYAEFTGLGTSAEAASVTPVAVAQDRAITAPTPAPGRSVANTETAPATAPTPVEELAVQPTTPSEIAAPIIPAIEPEAVPHPELSTGPLTQEASMILKEEPVNSAAVPAPAVGMDEAEIILPTRWPAEYATGYRMRNPNGVVIDVPGGLVRHEGWIESLAKHPMIRSVKSIQRETGARFIVYTNGELPRFSTNPMPTGIALRLYHIEGESEAGDQVAMAN